MATLFSCIVPTLDGDTYRVNIDDALYGGAANDVELAYGAFSIRYEGDSRDVFSPMMPSKCTVAIAVSDDNLSTIEAFGLNLVESGETRYTVRIDHKPDGGSYALYWVGYVIPDLSGFEDIDPPYRFSVTAADGLGRLKKTDYAQTSPDLPEGLFTGVGHIIRALSKDTTLRDLYWTGSDIYLKTVVNWQDSNMGAAAAAKCPLANTEIAGAVFSEKKESTTAGKSYDHMTCYEVIESIARHFAARFYFCEGAWRFEQTNERDQDTFYERRFDKTGTYVSGTATQEEDVIVQNVGDSNRLSGGIFSYMPALNKVTAKYLHDTGGNRWDGYQNYWGSLSPFTAIASFPLSSLSTDNIFRISGAINFEAELDTAYTRPWRYIFRLYIKVGSYTLEGASTNLYVGGNPTTTLNPVVPAWNNAGTNYYEISSSFCYGTLLNETINFSFDTPPIPAGTTFEAAFYTYLADNVDNDGESATVNYWGVLGPSLRIRSAADPNTDYETERIYTVTNDTVGNSEEVEQDFLFGHPVGTHTVGGIRTSPNSGVFTLSTATWDQGSGTEDLEFPQLWAGEVLAGRSTSRPIWAGTIKAPGMFANSRIIFPDSTGWLFLGGEFSATENTWNGDWVQAGVDRTRVIYTTPGIKIGGTIRFPRLNPFVQFPTVPPGSIAVGGFAGLTGFTSLALTALAVNEVETTVAAGTITSIPLGYAVNANDYIENDDIILVNPSTGEITSATVSATTDDGDTSLAVFSVTVPEIPSGAMILYGPLNKYTKQGGTHGKLPVGTAEGQILRWDNSDEEWTAYGGPSDGHVLTWDTTNGWQAEAAASGGINDGDTLSTGLTFPNTGLHILDTDASHDLILSPGSNLTADRTLTITTGDADRTLTLGGNVTLNGGTHSGTNTGDQTITLTGDVTGSGTGSFAATIANDAVTYSKIQNVTDARILGRSAGSAGDVQEITVGTGLSLSGGTLTNTVTAGVTGSGVANRIAIWTGTSTLGSDDSPLWFDGTNNRLGINTASPSGTLHVGVPTGTSLEGFRVDGNLSANLVTLIRNVNNASGSANAIFQILTGGTSAGDPTIQLSVSGGTTLSIGLDNSDSDKLKLKYTSTPSGTPINRGITMTSDSPHRVGINNDSPTQDLDVLNGVLARTHIMTNAAPTITPGTGMGTAPSGLSVLGGQNGFTYAFTTGTGPTANATIFTVQPLTPFPTFILPVFCAGNQQTATDISKFRISASGNTSFTVAANGTLSASTAYVLYFVVMGY